MQSCTSFFWFCFVVIFVVCLFGFCCCCFLFVFVCLFVCLFKLSNYGSAVSDQLMRVVSQTHLQQKMTVTENNVCFILYHLLFSDIHRPQLLLSTQRVCHTSYVKGRNRTWARQLLLYCVRGGMGRGCVAETKFHERENALHLRFLSTVLMKGTRRRLWLVKSWRHSLCI